MAEITVLMAVRNGEPYLEAAMESILRQTYGDFTFLVIDDASTDRTAEIVRSYEDKRIHLRSLERNIGQTAALNLGLHESRTEWIARMDADDYSAPRRFELQIQAAKADPALGCVGTFAWTFRENPEQVIGTLEKPVGNQAIRDALRWSAPIIHGSIMAKTKTTIEAGGYNLRYRYSADLDLYDRLLPRCHADNVAEPLLGIRRHAGQDSHSVKAIQESIEIFSRRLTSPGPYSAEDRAVVKAAIHLHEALCARLESRRSDTVAHVARAFWFAPALTLGHLFPRRKHVA